MTKQGKQALTEHDKLTNLSTTNALRLGLLSSGPQVAHQGSRFGLQSIEQHITDSKVPASSVPEETEGPPGLERRRAAGCPPSEPAANLCHQPLQVLPAMFNPVAVRGRGIGVPDTLQTR